MYMAVEMTDGGGATGEGNTSVEATTPAVPSSPARRPGIIVISLADAFPTVTDLNTGAIRATRDGRLIGTRRLGIQR